TNRDPLPDLRDPLPPGWHRLSVPEFEGVNWSFRRPSALFCNGIAITRDPKPWKDERDYSWRMTRSRIMVGVPLVSVFDPDGKLPVNLSRNDLTTDHLPFSDELLDAVIKDFIAFCLVYAPTSVKTGQLHRLSRTAHPAFSQEGSSTDRYLRARSQHDIEPLPWFIVRDGITIPDVDLVKWTGVQRILLAVRRYGAKWVPGFDRREVDAIYSCDSGSKWRNSERLWPLTSPLFHPRVDNPLAGIPVVGARCLVPKKISDALLTASDVTDAARLDGVYVERESPNLALLQMGSVPDGESLLSTLAMRPSMERNASTAAFLVEWYVRWSSRETEPSRLSELWREIVRQPVIPFDMATRRAILAHAFAELDEQVRSWEEMDYLDKDKWMSELRRAYYDDDFEDNELEDDEVDELEEDEL
ncbi:MAG TPA: hypothetical protein VF705_02835, partial [Longimicrobium sp.]